MLLFIAKADAHHLGFPNHGTLGSTVLSLPATSERHLGDIVVFHRHHVAILLLGNQPGCRSAQPGGQHAVKEQAHRRAAYGPGTVTLTSLPMTSCILAPIS